MLKSNRFGSEQVGIGRVLFGLAQCCWICFGTWICRGLALKSNVSHGVGVHARVHACMMGSVAHFEADRVPLEKDDTFRNELEEDARLDFPKGKPSSANRYMEETEAILNGICWVSNSHGTTCERSYGSFRILHR